MSKIVRIRIDVIGDDFEIDTGFRLETVTVHYTDVEVGTVYEEAAEIAECIKRIASAG